MKTKWERAMQQVEIRVKGWVDENWSEWFDDLAINHSGQNETAITDYIADQAALYGLLAKLRNLGLPLISVHSEERPSVQRHNS